MTIPFADHVGLVIEAAEAGTGRSHVLLRAEHLNSLGAAHGGVAFTLADTGMGAALRSLLGPEEVAPTLELKISYFKPAWGGTLECLSEVLHRGRSVASVQSRLLVNGELVAAATGTFAIRMRPSSVASASSPAPTDPPSPTA